MLDELDRVKMDVEILRKLVQPCLRTLPLRDALGCVRSILTRRADAVVDDLPSWAHGELDPETLDVLVDLLLDLLQREDMIAPPKAAAAADSPRSPQTREDERSQLLEMLRRLVMAGNHFALSGCNHDRLFKVLMAYRRMPEISAAETETPAGSSRQLIYIMLSALGSEIPSSAVIPQDVQEVIAYSKNNAKQDFRDDDRAVTCICLLAVMLIHALHPDSIDAISAPGVRAQLHEVLTIVHQSLRDDNDDVDAAATPRLSLSANLNLNMNSNSNLSCQSISGYASAIHGFLCAVKALLQLSPSVLPPAPWTDLRRDLDALRVDRQCRGAYMCHGCASAWGEIRDVVESIDKLQRGDPQAPLRRDTVDSTKSASRVAPPLGAPLRRTSALSGSSQTQRRSSHGVGKNGRWWGGLVNTMTSMYRTGTEKETSSV
ncbi:hypothetical protein C8Q74DRAFT_1363363 [Fomes fomentarius]|nr:hypothetical protein C8Q74DRAFT_1363363 [Fomes fomentarius]